MSVDLDDPWAEDLALERAESSRTARNRALSAPYPPLPPSGNSSPFTLLVDERTHAREDAGYSSSRPASGAASPRPSTVRGKAGKQAKPPPGISLSPGRGPPSTRPARSASHPLALDRLEKLSIASDTDMSDVSRPALKRVTSITDRQVAESQSQSRAESRCGSEVGSSGRGSVDLARAEVEVIVHQVKPSESLPGIALRYGIELAVLRKVNKLWPSDPVHLRTHLYVPLEACRSTVNGDQIVCGPGGGQVTIVPHKKRAAPNGSASEGHTNGSETTLRRNYSSSGLSERSGNGTITPEDAQLRSTVDMGGDESASGTVDDGAQVLDIVRLPASQLRFFPRSKRETPRSRASLDSDIGRSADSVRGLSAAERARKREAKAAERGMASASVGRSMGATMFAPLGALTAAAEAAVAPKKRVVRLRPPQAPAPVDDSFTGQLRSLFTVPPPPVDTPPPRPRIPRETRPARSESVGSDAVPQVPVQAELEMDARPWGSSNGRSTPRTLRKTNKKLD